MIELKSDEQKIKTIIDYYVLSNKLKDVVRSGWKIWGITRDRVESVAEHIYGTCMLAIAIWSETLPKVNLSHVLTMLVIHETEEILIGDITPFDSQAKQKIKASGIDAVKRVFSDFVAKDVYINIIKEFDEAKTPEAIFAKECDKLESDLQAKLYYDEGALVYEKAGEIKNNELIKEYYSEYGPDVSKHFSKQDKHYYKKGDIFYKINEFLLNNNLKIKENN